jgi:hypothetical protein
MSAPQLVVFVGAFVFSLILIGVAMGALSEAFFRCLMRHVMAWEERYTAQNYSKQQRWKHRGLVWLALALVLGTGLGSMVIATQWTLLKHGRTTSGRVLANLPRNVMRYEYSVGERRYTGETPGNNNTHKAPWLKVGQRIPVTYDRRRPAVSKPDDVRQRVRDSAIVILAAMTIFPLLMMRMGRVCYPVWKRAATTPPKLNRFVTFFIGPE